MMLDSKGDGGLYHFFVSPFFLLPYGNKDFHEFPKDNGKNANAFGSAIVSK